MIEFARRWIALAAPLAAMAALGGCRLPPEPAAAAAGAHAAASPAPLPRIVATNCQGCHAVRPHLASPNPAAPSFVAVANMEGVTPNTLAAFLRDAHNYPDEMKMTLSEAEVEAITGYVLTLRDPTYRPIP